MRAFLLCLALVLPKAYADTAQDNRLWLTYTMAHQVNHDWRLSLQVQPYWRDNAHAYDQVTYRTGVYYRANQQWTLGAGYAYALGHPQAHTNSHEHRLWEDIVRQFNIDPTWQLSLRTRLEHRHIEQVAETAHGLREQLRLVAPINADYQWVISDESYFNLNTTASVQSGFDQNRLFVGLAHAVSSRTNIEFGYMNQYAKRSLHDVDNHILALSFSQTF